MMSRTTSLMVRSVFAIYNSLATIGRDSAIVSALLK